MSYNSARLRRLNDKKIAGGGQFVLYWMQSYRRLDHNHALDYALRCAAQLGKPLVETPAVPARGLLVSLARRAALVVTDDLPCFIVPAHGGDKRAFVYSPEEWEAGATHDPLWNAAQRELVATGTIHNYLRMLWDKKALEWSKSPDEAYKTLEHLNNRYALDGRDPSSYSGILWCFGLFDRPGAPERRVLGVLRYMSSENAARKFKLGPYYDYVNGLPTIEAVCKGAAGGKA